MSGKRELFSAVMTTGMGLGAVSAAPVPEPAAPASRPSDPNTLDRVGAALAAFGYRAEPFLDERGTVTGYRVHVTIGGVDQAFILDPGPDGRLVLTAGVGPVRDPATVPAAGLMKLLAANASIRPAFFTYDDRARQVALRLTPADPVRSVQDVRRQIEQFRDLIQKTADVWTGV